MKTIYLILIAILHISIGYSQKKPEKVKIFKTKIQCYENKKIIKGTFYSYDNLNIYLLDTKSKDDIINYRFQFIEIPVSTIKQIKVKRNGKLAYSCLLGVLVGGTTGAVIGYSQGDDEPPCGWFGDGGCMSAGDKAALLGIPLGLVGGIIGSIAGAKYTQLDIQGKEEHIQKYRKQLDQYSILKN